MFDAFLLACRDVVAPRQRRALFRSLLIAAIAIVLVWIGVGRFLAESRLVDISWLDTGLRLLGGVATVALSWLLYPAVVTLVMGFFLDGVIADLERAHYPGLPPTRKLGMAEIAWSAVSLTLLMIVANLLLLPFYLFWPGVNLVLFYSVNGYLLGRQYFDLVAMRRFNRAGRRSLWRREWGRLVVAGMAIAFLLSLPLVNLVAPLLACAFLVHLLVPASRPAPAGVGGA